MSNDKLAEALRDSTFVAAMLDAICETDGTVDRMKARDAACRVREALQAHAKLAALRHENAQLRRSDTAMNDYDKLIATLRKTIKTWRKRARKADVQDDDAFAAGFKICATRLEAILREHTMPKPAEE